MEKKVDNEFEHVNVKIIGDKDKYNYKFSHTVKRGMNAAEKTWFRQLVSTIPDLKVNAETLKFIEDNCFPLAEDLDFHPLFSESRQQIVTKEPKKFALFDWWWSDSTPGQIYPSAPKARRCKTQLSDIKPYLKTIEYRPFDKQDAEDTIGFRKEIKRYKRTLHIEKLTSEPMYSDDNGIAMMTPNGCFLSFKSVRWMLFVIDLINHLLPLASEREKSNVLTLAIDYSYWIPESNDIRKDGRMVPAGGAFSSELKNQMRELFSEIFAATWKLDWVDCIPPLKRTKAPGFFDVFPDGTPYVKSEFSFTARSLASGDKASATLRYDTSPIKKAWFESGGVLRNFKHFCASIGFGLLKGAAKLKELVVRLALFVLSVHVRGYRMNGPDAPKYDVDNEGLQAKQLKKGCKKDRLVGFEDPDKPLVYCCGEVDDLKWEEDFRARDYNRIFVALRKRVMYPGPNTTYSPPFILFARRLLKGLEESVCGFPCNRPHMLEYLNKVMNKHKTDSVIRYFNWDRSNSEQFITDILEEILECLPKKLADFIRDALVSVLPSRHGGRVSNGCLLSGTALTTLINYICGLIEWVRIVAITFEITTKEVVDQIKPYIVSAILDVIENGKVTTVPDLLEIVPGTWITVTAGTDDQIFGCEASESDMKRYESNFTKALEGRFLSGGCDVDCSVFGLAFGQDAIDVDPVLGLAKLFYIEHARLGDEIALKMDARFRLLGKFFEPIEDRLIAHGFGPSSLYHAGAMNKFDQLQKMGYPVDELYNVHSPKEELVYGPYLKSLGYNPVDTVQRYTVEDYSPINDELEKLFGDGFN